MRRRRTSGCGPACPRSATTRCSRLGRARPAAGATTCGTARKARRRRCPGGPGTGLRRLIQARLIQASAAFQNRVSVPAVVAGASTAGECTAPGMHTRRPPAAWPSAPGCPVTRIVVLAVDDQHRSGRPGRAGSARPSGPGRSSRLPGHEDQAVRVVAEHPLGQERHDRARDPGRDGLRLQVLLPDVGDPGPQRGRRRQVVLGAQHAQACPSAPRPAARSGPPGRCSSASPRRARHGSGLQHVSRTTSPP